MKNPMEVLRSKELEMLKVKKEVEALQIVVRLLNDDATTANGQKDLRQLIEMP